MFPLRAAFESKQLHQNIKNPSGTSVFNEHCITIRLNKPKLMPWEAKQGHCKIDACIATEVSLNYDIRSRHRDFHGFCQIPVDGLEIMFHDLL